MSALATAGAASPAAAAANARRTIRDFVIVRSSRSVDVVLRIVDVELAGRRDQLGVFDDGLQLARLVVDDHDRRLLVLRTPHREPDLVARLVVLGLRDPL